MNSERELLVHFLAFLFFFVFLFSLCVAQKASFNDNVNNEKKRKANVLIGDATFSTLELIFASRGHARIFTNYNEIKSRIL